jgi:hypothetical protein
MICLLAQIYPNCKRLDYLNVYNGEFSDIFSIGLVVLSYDAVV